MATCIPPKIIEEIKPILDPNLSSTERLTKLADKFGLDQAQEINLLFERALLATKQKAALSNMMKKLSMTPEDQAAAKQVITDRVARREAQITDDELSSIVKNIYDKKYNIELSVEQAAKVARLNKEVKEALELGKDADGNYHPSYGAALDEMGTFLEHVKDPTKKLDFFPQIKATLKKDAEYIKGIDGNYSKFAFATGRALRYATSPIFKAMKASIDASFIGIQGIAIATRNPAAFKSSLIKSIQTLKDPNTMKAFRTEMFSWGGYDDAIKSGLRLSDPEEQFAGLLAEKIPFWVGKAIKKSDDAFSIFLMNARKMEYQRVLKTTEKNLGRKLNVNNPADAKTMKEIANHANKVTGTSNLGGMEKHADLLNRLLFAGRYAVSDMKMYTDLLDPRLSVAARTRAAETLGLNLAGVVGAYTTFAMLHPDNADLNPLSSNFMKIKLEDGTVVGGKFKGQWVVQLISKMLIGKEINSRGKTIEYGEGYRAKTRLDAAGRVLRGKLAPSISVVTDLLAGKTYMGEDLTVAGEAVNLAAPIAPSDIIQRLVDGDDDASTQMRSAFFDALGLTNYTLGR